MHQEPQPLERIELALDRHQKRLGGDHRVDREQTEARRTVDEDVLVAAVPGGLQRVAQAMLATCHADQLDLGAGQGDVGGHDVEAGHGGGNPGVDKRTAQHHHVVAARPDGPPIHPQARGRVRLRIHVDQEHAPSPIRQGRSQVDRSRRLAHAALLVGDGENGGAHGCADYVGSQDDLAGCRHREPVIHLFPRGWVCGQTVLRIRFTQVVNSSVDKAHPETPP